MRLLVAEDDPKLLKTLTHLFTINNYSVDGVDNGSDALDYALTGDYDGLVLDIMMPEMDGITVLKKLRKSNISTPALFLSARTEVYQKVEGLDAGADDYLPKPFSTPELLARVRAMLRRKDNYVPDIIKFCDVALNRSTYEMLSNGKRISLSGKEFQVFEMLIQRANILVSTEQFLTRIWGWDTNVDTSVMWVHISNIRKKMEKVGVKEVRIRYVRNAGYILEEDK